MLEMSIIFEKFQQVLNFVLFFTLTLLITLTQFILFLKYPKTLKLCGTSAVIIGAKNFRMFKLKIKREQKMELNIFFVNYENILLLCFHKFRECLKILPIGGKDKKSQFRKKKLLLDH